MKKQTDYWFIFLLVVNLFSASLSAEEQAYTISGVIQQQDGEKVGGVDVVLLDTNGNVVERTFSGKHQKSEGKFEFRRILPGEYTVEAKDEKIGISSIDITLTSNDQELELTMVLSREEPGKGGDSGRQVLSIPGYDMVQFTAELNHQGNQIRDLQTKSKIWANPRAFYRSEIIFKNGSTLLGEIIYQDENIVKVETLVGDAVINREEIVQIVRNLKAGRAEARLEYIPEQVQKSSIPSSSARMVKPRYIAGEPIDRNSSRRIAANIVLMGDISEGRDQSKNTIYSGRVKNIGGRRSDFTKVSFVFKNNRDEEIQTLTTFVKGNDFSFNSGITTDSSLNPGASGTFELMVPPDIESYRGYTYKINWEEYQ